MSTRKKITRREIKEPDEFITLSTRAIEFAREHGREALWALAGVMVLAVAISVWRVHAQNQEKKARELLAESQQLLGAISQEREENASGQNEAAAAEVLQRLVKDYGGTRAAQTARLLLGELYYRQNDFGKAIDTYKAFLDEDGDVPELTALAWESLGYCYEAQENYEEAASCYEKASRAASSFHPGDALLGLARSQEKLGKLEQAADAYRKLTADYPQHPSADQARAGLSRIEKIEPDEGKEPGPGKQAQPEVKSTPEDAAAPAPSSPPGQSK
ncbi:MAG: tetratricopeptide repeat protein [bacterium]